MVKNIILLIPNLDFGGAQRVFYDHSLVLKENCVVTECVFNEDFGHAYKSDNHFHSLDVPAGKNILDKAIRFLQRCWKLYLLKKQIKPSVVISHLEGADYVNLLTPGGGKKVLYIHGSKLHDGEINGFLGVVRKNFFIPMLYSFADKIITVSKGIKTELVCHFNISEKKIAVIYNFFDLKRIIALSNEKVGLSDKKTSIKLVTSGRLAIQKNQIALLPILKLIRDQFLKVQLYFLGDGPLKQNIINEALSLNLTYAEFNELNDVFDVDIVFLGYQENPFKFLKRMDIFLLPSSWEGFPMALGEAMVLGLPSIASDCPTGPAELFLQEDYENSNINYPMYGENGVLLPVPKKDEPQSLILWAETIIKLIENDDMRIQYNKSAKQRMNYLDISAMKKLLINEISTLN